MSPSKVAAADMRGWIVPIGGAEEKAAADASIRWDDADIAIDWPISAPLLSEKDAKAPFLQDVPRERIPRLVPARSES